MTSAQMASKVHHNFEVVLNEVSKLDTLELESFLAQVSLLLARRKAPSLPKQESILLQKINQGLSPILQQRYNFLQTKLHAETITPTEHQELLALLDQIELADAKRLQYLLELAQLRHISLDILMHQLDIHPPQVQ